MKRKVIKQGHNTLTITLPNKWVKSTSVKAGDELSIEEKGNSLQVTSNLRKQKERVVFDITKFDVALEQVIYAAYKKGYDEIEFYSSDSALFSKVQKIILGVVVGFEVVSQSKNVCIIKSVVDMNDTEFDPIMRRVFLLLHSMEDGILASIVDKDASSLKTFRDMESMNNRYTGFCRRLLNKLGYGEPKNEKFLYSMIEFLEKVADEYKYLCDFFMTNRGVGKISKENIHILKRISILSRKIEKLYYKFDVQNYLEIYRERKDLIKNINSAYLKQRSPDTIFLHYMLTTTQLYVDITNFILTMNL